MNITITDLPFKTRKKTFSYTEFRKFFTENEKENLYKDFLDFHEIPTDEITSEQQKKAYDIREKPLSDLINI